MFYISIIDFSLEMPDLIHRIYEADESFRSLDFMVHNWLRIPHGIIQILIGTLTPDASRWPAFAMRRNVVIGACAAAAPGSLKLLPIDFRQSTPATPAFSLLCYGGLLLLLPKMRFNTETKSR